MEMPIIAIPRANEMTILWLVNIGVLEITENGPKVIQEEK